MQPDPLKAAVVQGLIDLRVRVTHPIDILWSDWEERLHKKNNMMCIALTDLELLPHVGRVIHNLIQCALREPGGGSCASYAGKVIRERGEFDRLDDLVYRQTVRHQWIDQTISMVQCDLINLRGLT